MILIFSSHSTKFSRPILAHVASQFIFCRQVLYYCRVWLKLEILAMDAEIRPTLHVEESVYYMISLAPIPSHPPGERLYSVLSFL